MVLDPLFVSSLLRFAQRTLPCSLMNSMTYSLILKYFSIVITTNNNPFMTGPTILNTTVLGIEEDVNHRNQARWMKLQSASGVICDRNVSPKLKKIFLTIILHAMLNDTECWTLKCQQDNKLNVVEILLEVLVRKVNQMEDCRISRGRRKPGKTISETIRKKMEINDLSFIIV
ncbi:hypothetical protein Lal_00015251 [Lupinus albus]|nr:hypothetical protein Lal_00015251 [Lupinus albus]